MDVITKSHRMGTIPALYDMQTIFFMNALEGISDKDAHSRLDTKANHIIWLAGSLVQQRCELAELLDKTDKSHKQKADAFFKNNQGIMDGINYPPLDQFKKDWQTISPILRQLLLNADDTQLDRPFQMPGETISIFDLLSFISYREANCIGQIALWRRILGYDPMKYN